MLRMGKQTKEEQPANATPPPPAAAPDTSTPYGQKPPQNTDSSYRAPVEASSPHNHAAPAPSGTGRAVTESESLARDIKDGNLSGFVGAGTAVTGEATFKMMLRVDGHISGRVTSEDGTLIVSAGGQVDANVDVAVALVNGTINGDIVATKRIEIGRAGKVLGNIQTPALIIENGAIFEGGCRMMQVKADLNKKQVNEVLSTPPVVGAPKKSDISEPSQVAS